MTHEDTFLKFVADMSGAIGRIEGGLDEVKENQKEFRMSLVRLFDKHAECPGPHAADQLDALRKELDALRDATTTTRMKKDSSEKISRPPAARSAISDRTVQMLIVLVIVAIGGGSILVQLFGG